MKNVIAVIVFSLLWIMSQGQITDSVVTLPTVTITTQPMVNAALDRSFLKKFPHAEDVVWSRLDKDYLARFMQNDLKHQSLFKKNGFLRYDITYMPEPTLPFAMRQKIARAYDAYKIVHGARIRRADQDFWIVNLESLTTYVVLRVENGDLEEVRRMTKAAP